MFDILTDAVCSKLSIFPDEADSEDECTKNLPSTTADTRTITKSTNWRIVILNDWKHRSKLFKECQMDECDPLNQFCGRFICKSCKLICLIWPKNELFDIILDYIYFHCILVFDRNAEVRFAAENSTHPYLNNFMRIRKFNSNLIESLSGMFQFSDTMQNAVKSHSELTTVVDLQLSCEICGDNIPKHSRRIFILSGRRYCLSTYKILKRQKGEQVEQRFFLCKLHGEIFRIYFYITHMSWLTYWNCYHRVQAVLSERGSTESAEEIIDSIEPFIFKNLAQFFYCFYRRLDNVLNISREFRYYAIEEWQAFVDKWKCSILLQSISPTFNATSAITTTTNK